MTEGASRDGAGTAVSVRGLTKVFGSGASQVVAVDGIDLDIADGEFVTLLGPSGSGKTTVLRMIAGFERPTSGTVSLRGRDVTALAPFERDVNTVFQDYALFPHLSVLGNVEYGPRVKKVPAARARERALAALASVRLAGLEQRSPGQLSGGQRQRVALARALVNAPTVLLLDEPLGALDLKLREQMQLELKQIQRDVGITFVFVTHDQEEALTMSDRIVVFDRGRIEQVGTPSQVYERPATAFVAGFVGTSNLLSAAGAGAPPGSARPREVYSIRPEKLRLLLDGRPAQPGDSLAQGTVRDVVYAGATTRVIVRLDGGDDLVVVQHNAHAGPVAAPALQGRAVRVAWSPDDAVRIPDRAVPDRTAPDRTSDPRQADQADQADPADQPRTN